MARTQKVRSIPGLTIFKGDTYYMFTMDTTLLSIKAASARAICHLCQFTPLHTRVKIISDGCLQLRICG